MSEAEKLDQAFEDKATKMAIYAYIARGVTLCIEKGILSPNSQSKSIWVSPQGLRMLGTLNFEEKTLRESFMKMSDAGYISDVVDYDDVFNGVISKGETLH